MTDKLADLEAKAKAARELSSDHKTPGVWMHLFGDRFVYTRLEDGCRGRSVVGVDIIRNAGDSIVLDYVAAANPADILSFIASHRALEARVKKMEKTLRTIQVASAEALDQISDETSASYRLFTALHSTCVGGLLALDSGPKDFAAAAMENKNG